MSSNKIGDASNVQKDQTKQIQGLYVMFDYMIQKINNLKETIEDMEKIIKTLQEENTLLNENGKQYEKKYKAIENFVEICTDQMPKLLTRLVVNTQSEDLRISMDQTIKALEIKSVNLLTQ